MTRWKCTMSLKTYTWCLKPRCNVLLYSNLQSTIDKQYIVQCTCIVIQSKYNTGLTTWLCQIGNSLICWTPSSLVSEQVSKALLNYMGAGGMDWKSPGRIWNEEPGESSDVIHVALWKWWKSVYLIEIGNWQKCVRDNQCAQVARIYSGTPVYSGICGASVGNRPYNARIWCFCPYFGDLVLV